MNISSESESCESLSCCPNKRRASDDGGEEAEEEAEENDDEKEIDVEDGLNTKVEATTTAEKKEGSLAEKPLLNIALKVTAAVVHEEELLEEEEVVEVADEGGGGGTENKQLFASHAALRKTVDKKTEVLEDPSCPKVGFLQCKSDRRKIFGFVDSNTS